VGEDAANLAGTPEMMEKNGGQVSEEERRGYAVGLCYAVLWYSVLCCW